MSSVVHFELLSAAGGAPALRDFYAKTFGWSYDMAPGTDYALVAAPEDGRGIGGAVAEAEDGQPRVAIYVEVDDPAEYLERVRANGGEIVRDVTVVPGMVTFGEFRDPAGNIVGVAARDVPPEA